MFEYENGNFKITSKEENDRWKTSVFFNDKLCAEIKHNGSLLDPTNKKKIDQAIKGLIPKPEERAPLLLEMTDSFGNWIENPKKWLHL